MCGESETHVATDGCSSTLLAACMLRAAGQVEEGLGRVRGGLNRGWVQSVASLVRMTSIDWSVTVPSWDASQLWG